MRREAGFSLIEMATVMAVIAILATLAIPVGLQMQQSALFRQEAARIGAMLRDARARTVSLNREHRVEFNLTAGANGYRLARGDASSGSTVWNVVGAGWTNASQAVVLTQVGCPAGVAPIAFTVDFNSNGSVGTGCVVEIRDAGLILRRTVTVTQNTGRVRLQ